MEVQPYTRPQQNYSENGRRGTQGGGLAEQSISVNTSEWEKSMTRLSLEMRLLPSLDLITKFSHDHIVVAQTAEEIAGSLHRMAMGLHEIVMDSYDFTWFT